MSTPTKFPTMTQDEVIASLAERAGMKHVILTEGAARAGQRISDRFRKALPALPESNANTLAAIIEAELGIPVMLAERDAVQAENTRLREALRNVLKLLDEGKLVRNISGDGAPDWAIKQLPMIQVLSAAAKLAYPDEALAAGKGERDAT